MISPEPETSYADFVADALTARDATRMAFEFASMPNRKNDDFDTRRMLMTSNAPNLLSRKNAESR